MTIKKILLLIFVVIILFFTVAEVLNMNVPFRVKTLFSTMFSESPANPSGVLVPKLEDSDNDLFYKDHFLGNVGYFVLVQSQPISVYKAPDLEMETGQKLAGCVRVRILFRKPQVDYIGDDVRQWVFIASESGKRLIGWVFLDQLRFPSNFKPATEIDLNRFSYTRDQYKADVSISDGNRFVMDWSARGQGLLLKGSMSGQFMQADDIIWAKKDDQDFIYDFFVKTSNVDFVQEWKFKDDEITMGMFLIPDK